jgi:hypothetical protein
LPGPLNDTEHEVAALGGWNVTEPDVDKYELSDTPSSSTCGLTSKSHCGYSATSTQDSSSRNEPSNFSNLSLQHLEQPFGPVVTQVLPGSDGDDGGDGVRLPTLTNFQRWRPLPSSFLSSFR